MNLLGFRVGCITQVCKMIGGNGLGYAAIGRHRPSWPVQCHEHGPGEARSMDQSSRLSGTDWTRSLADEVSAVTLNCHWSLGERVGV